MKNKKGFTLIELLAVIVVLAIIALIATPIVMNTIKNAKKGAAERTADNYIKQVETAVAEARIDGTKVANGTYNIQPDGNLCPASGCGENDKDKITIDMSGTKPTSGTIKISNGQVTTDSTMTVGSYEVAYDPTTKKYEATKKGSASTGDDKPTIPDTPSTTVVYRWSEEEINILDVIDPNDTSKFTKDANTLGKNYYLKHVLDKDNIILETYACSKLNGKEYCLTTGEYGWSENEDDYTGNMLILKRLKDAGLNCEGDENVFSCDDGSTYLSADTEGLVSSYDAVGSCDVDSFEISACGNW